MIYATKELQNTPLYKEYAELQNKYYKSSLEKEYKQQKYFKNLLIKDLNKKENIKINYSFEKYYKKYTKSIEQKVFAIEEIAKERNLVPVFLTFTLPTEFHPFQSIKNTNGKRLYIDYNYNFQYKNIEESILNGYQYLNEIYRTFYKRVKNDIKDLLFVKVVEMHKTCIPHFHILFYIKKDLIEKLHKNFVKIINEFNLSQTDFELVQNELENKKRNFKTYINRASLYIIKYITKSLKDGSDYFNIRVIDGWKRLNKIRLITTSNLSLSLSDYRAIYSRIDEDIKKELLEKVLTYGISIFYYILKNISIITIIKNNNKKTKVKQLNTKKFKQFVLVKTLIPHKNKKNGGYYKKISNLTIFINNKLVYKLSKYSIKKLKNMEKYYYEY